MKTAYTPGPWQAGLNLPQVANNNPDVRLVWSDSLLVCDCRSNWIEPGTAAANARLIAAVPELLTSLVCLIKMVRDGDLTSDVIEEADAAIAKATRGQP